MVKKVLLQDREAKITHCLDNMVGLLEIDFEGEDVEFEKTHCLSEIKLPLGDYNLIFIHPHMDERECCHSALKNLNDLIQNDGNKIQIFLAYNTVSGNGEIEVVSQGMVDGKLEIPVGKRRRVYGEVVRDYLL